MIALIMKYLARADFERGTQARISNVHYQNEYGRLYQQAAIQDYYSGV